MDVNNMEFFGLLLVVLLAFSGMVAISFSESLLERMCTVSLMLIGLLFVSFIFFGG